MILILSDKSDAHYQYMQQRLVDRGEEVFTLDTSQFPHNFSIGYDFSDQCLEVTVGNGEKKISGKEIASIWNRRRPPTKLPKSFSDEAVREYIVRESQIFLSSLHDMLKSPLWVSNPDSLEKASRKPYQLLVAQEMGFCVPETFIGNSVSVATEFLASHNDIALKAIGMGAIEIRSESCPEFDCMRMYTRRLDNNQLEAVLPQVQNCPVIIQPYVQKDFELRITVVGTKVFACAIYSQMAERTKEDWRRYDFLKTPHRAYTLPKEVEQRCLALMSTLGLMFGCIDMIVTPKGEYVFLEINPNGQWLWIERMTGMPIADALIDMLIAGKVV